MFSSGKGIGTRQMTQLFHHDPMGPRPSQFTNGHFWSPGGRLAVFLLSFTSIAALLVEFYGIIPMRTFTLGIFLPSLLLLGILAVFDGRNGNGALARAVAQGCLGGLIAAIAYDIFRLPFVFAKPWGLDAWVPALPLFKVFPRFGALILGEPLEQVRYSLADQWVGWSYHFSNGATFGVLYLASIGDPRRRHWAWAVVMAVGLELGMLFTPYPAYFHIRVSGTFIAVTLSAHLIFGVVLGRVTRFLALRKQPLPSGMTKG